MNTILLFISLAIFLPFLSSALSTNNQVLDLHGKPLNTNSRYFIVSAFNGAGGGGVRLANFIDDQEETTCLTSVVQSSSEFDDGIAVYFTPQNPDKYQGILESSPLNINFFLDTYLCANMTVWKVDYYPEPAEYYTISTGAKLGDPLDVNSWFQIQPSGTSSYKLVFCPYGEPFTCQNINILNESGYRRLVLAENPKPFVFILDDRIGKAEA